MTTKVLAFSGSGRTGSTVLELLLGQQPGFTAVGELTRLWFHGYHKNVLCGSRVPVRESDFWIAVADEVFGGLDKVDGVAISRLKVGSYLEAFRIITNTASPGTMRRIREYGDILSRTYHAISKLSGDTVVVDASKDTRHVCVLDHVPDIEYRLLHLVRDARAVVYSWSKRKPRLDTEGYIQQSNIFISCMKWNFQNLYSEMLKRHAPGMRIRYEDFVPDIEGTLSQIIEFTGVENATVTTELDMERITEQHGIWGNPVRFEKNINIHADMRWRTEMPRRHRYITTFLTFALLKYYHY